MPLAPAGSVPAAQSRRRPIRVGGDPVTRNIDPTADPDAIVLTHIVEEALQRCDPAGAPDQPAVQSNRQHLRRVQTAGIALTVKSIEGSSQVVVELLA